MEDSLLLTILQEQTRVATRTEQKVEDMTKRLFGNGQPGVIQKISSDIESTHEQLSNAKKELEIRIDTVDSAHKMDRRWLKGACAVLIFELAAVGFYFKYLYAIIHSHFP